MRRRTFSGLGIGLGPLAAAPALLAFSACSSTSPPQRFYRLPTDPPAGEAAPPAGFVAGTSARVWELATSLPMPELLERDTLLVEEGAAGIRLLHGHRWAEPLRDALPRLLRHDLALWLPGLWPAPAPPSVVVAGRLQVELLALHGNLPRRQVLAAARWVITPTTTSGTPTTTSGTTLDPAPKVVQAEEQVPWPDGTAESLVVAQRAAMWRLARRIAASVDAAA